MAEKLYAHYYNAQRLLQKLAQLDATQSFQEEGAEDNNIFKRFMFFYSNLHFLFKFSFVLSSL